MTLKRQLDGNRLTVTPKGRIDTLTAPRLEEALEALPPAVTSVIFDFGGVDYISSAGLRVLLATQKRMKPAGGAIRVINISKTVQEIFDITGFTGIFTG